MELILLCEGVLLDGFFRGNKTMQGEPIRTVLYRLVSMRACEAGLDLPVHSVH